MHATAAEFGVSQVGGMLSTAGRVRELRELEGFFSSFISIEGAGTLSPMQSAVHAAFN